MNQGHHVRRSRIGSYALALHLRVEMYQANMMRAVLHIAKGNLKGTHLEKSMIMGMAEEENRVSRLEMWVSAIGSVRLVSPC